MALLDKDAGCESCAATRAEVDEFAYRASHDLRAPVRHAGAFLALLSDKLKEDADPESQKWFSMATQSTRRLERMLQGLLEYSRAAQPNTTPSSFDAAKIVSSQIQSRTVEIQRLCAEFDIAESFPSMFGSAEAFGKVVGILIDNALESAGEIAPKIEIAVEDTNDTIATLHFRDRGEGFDPTLTEEIFKPLRTLRGPNETDGGGMGLAIARRLVEVNGGTIAAQSETDEGAIFTIRWPTEQR